MGVFQGGLLSIKHESYYITNRGERTVKANYNMRILSKRALKLRLIKVRRKLAFASAIIIFKLDCVPRTKNNKLCLSNDGLTFMNVIFTRIMK